VVMPHGVLFRGGAEGKIRQGILDDDLLEAVIGLPANLFYGTGIPACILVINRDKAPEQKGKTFILDGSKSYQEATNQNVLRDEDISNIVKAYNDWEDKDKYCRVVDIEEIQKKDYKLNIVRYIDKTEPEEVIVGKEEINYLKIIAKECDVIERDIF